MRLALVSRILAGLLLCLGGLAALAQVYGFIHPVDSGAITIYIVVTVLLFVFGIED